MFNFEKLLIWQKAVEFADAMYDVSKSFPKEETFGMTSQLRRASVSIALNIAEGAGRRSKKEFCHFLSMANGSLCEVVTLLRLCVKQKYINPETQADFYRKGEELARMLNRLSQNFQLSSLNSKL